jgi:hypothetical protein
MFNFCFYAPNAERQKPGNGLLRFCIRNALDELMDSANSIGSYIVARVIEDEIQNQVEQGFGQVSANLRTRASNVIDDGYCIHA